MGSFFTETVNPSHSENWFISTSGHGRWRRTQQRITTGKGAVDMFCAHWPTGQTILIGRLVNIRAHTTLIGVQ